MKILDAVVLSNSSRRCVYVLYVYVCIYVGIHLYTHIEIDFVFVEHYFSMISIPRVI